MTNPTRSFTATTTANTTAAHTAAANTYIASGSVQASAYQQGTQKASPHTSAATSGNTASIFGASHTASELHTGSSHASTTLGGASALSNTSPTTATTATTATSPTTVTTATTAANTSSIGSFAGIASAALNSSLAKSSLSCSTSITNLTVSSLEETVTFYTNVFGWEVEQMTENYALLTNGTSSLCAITEDYANEVYGFTTSSPFSSGNFPTVTTTLVCKDVAAIWDAAIASGATPVQSPATNVNNITSATLIGPDNYVWVITNNSNMLI
jgi:predicted enzyme related to lactoylglutathione lyase